MSAVKPFDFSYERISDPAGWLWRHNRKLVEFLATSPNLAQLVRQICEGVDIWAGERGIPGPRIGTRVIKSREGRVVIRCYDTARETAEGARRA